MKWDLKWLGLLSFNVFLIVSTALYFHATQQIPDTASGFTSLNQAIENASNFKLDLSPVKDEISQLSTLIKQMQNQEEVPIDTLLSNTSSELQAKLDTIFAAIESLEEKTHPLKILPESALPFKVVSIDSLQHQSVATVSYEYKTTALEKGDSLAGWQVESIDFAKQTIALKNDKGCVFVSLVVSTGEGHA